MKENPRIKPIEQATHKSWTEWLTFMDSIDAKNLNHHEIATKVLEQLMSKLDNPGWWAQSVTVAYEQYIGRRIPGQQPDGTFQTSVSKATKLGMKELMEAWSAFASKDPEVLDLITAEVKIGGTEKRLTWRTKSHDNVALTIISEPKSNGTSSIVVQHLGSPTLELNNEAKETWSVIIGRFLDQL